MASSTEKMFLYLVIFAVAVTAEVVNDHKAARKVWFYVKGRLHQLTTG